MANHQDRGLKYSLARERTEPMDTETLEREASNPSSDAAAAAAARDELIDRAGR